VPIDSNQNPEGAHLDEDRFFARFGYDRTLSSAAWSTTLSFTHSGQQQFRGFLSEVSSVFPNARGFRADIDTNDLYFDTHLAWTKSPSWHLVAGADYLFGKAEAKGDTFDYGVELDGDGAPSDIPTGELRRIEDTRNFMGLYANLEWLPDRDAALRRGRAPQPHGRGAGRGRGSRGSGRRRGRQAQRHAAVGRRRP
jgi:hypothetical protein